MWGIGGGLVWGWVGNVGNWRVGWGRDGLVMWGIGGGLVWGWVGNVRVSWGRDGLVM
jgi:hypothetical protein